MRIRDWSSDVGSSELRIADVHVDPDVVGDEVLSLLPEALSRRARGRRITINLVRADARPVSVCFGDAKAAIRYLEGSVRIRRGPGGAPSIDDILGGIAAAPTFEIGRASCRERVCQYV